MSRMYVYFIRSYEITIVLVATIHLPDYTDS